MPIHTKRSTTFWTLLLVVCLRLCYCEPAYAATRVQGTLTLAAVRALGDAVEISYGDSFAFRVPLEAGYVISESRDRFGQKHLHITNSNASGLDFQVTVDLFPLDDMAYTPLDAMAEMILRSDRSRLNVTESRDIRIAGLHGFELIMTGVTGQTRPVLGETRFVFLTDLNSGIAFQLIGYQPNSSSHRLFLDSILSSLVLKQGWNTHLP